MRDEIVYKKIQLLQWVELKHLDIKIDQDSAAPFLRVAQKGAPPLSGLEEW